MTRTLSLWIAFFFLFPESASAQLVASAGAGVFDPWKGSTGYEIDTALFATLGEKQSWRLGGEFSFRAAEFEILNVENVDFESYRLSFVTHYRFLVGHVVEPYLGIRITFSVTQVDANEVERQRPSRPIENDGVGLGGAGIVGIDVPIGDRFALYGEVSAGADVVWIDENDDDHQGIFPISGRIGGISGVAGVRLRF